MRAAGASAAMVLTAFGLGGCEVDSFFDPSVTGRWEKTPTVMPVLDRLSQIEDEPTEFVQSSGIVASDLVPEVDQYRFGPGDSVEIRIRDYFTLGQDEAFDRIVDTRGYIDIPRLNPIRAQGKTTSELTTAIENAVREKQINDRPVVALNVRSQRKQTFSVIGAVQTPGTFFVPSPDYRLLEGLTSAGALNETIPFVYVIRQVPLTDAAAGRIPEPEPVKKSRGGKAPTDVRPQPAGTDEPKSGEDLINLIDELSKPAKKEPGNPALMSPAPAPVAPVRVAKDQPPIDLPDTRPVGSSSGGGSSGGGGATGSWMYVDGKWVKNAGAGSGAGANEPALVEQNLVTQRVIKIPMGPLLAGAADVNIVIRPGDVIRVPVPRGGLVYVTGHVVRPGPYNLPTDGKLTLLRALDSAGGLNQTAIPERVDLMRMVGNDRQATIRLNVRAIAEQAQPDIYLKPDDRINVGTNFWATPLAVIRNGFRASYGFGFILDRNFQGEVFGRDAAITRN